MECERIRIQELQLYLYAPAEELQMSSPVYITSLRASFACRPDERTRSVYILFTVFDRLTTVVPRELRCPEGVVRMYL